jgi:hypothetical protein
VIRIAGHLSRRDRERGSDDFSDSVAEPSAILMKRANSRSLRFALPSVMFDKMDIVDRTRSNIAC